MGPTQLADVLRRLPTNANPNLLVGFETSDDAGVFLLSEDRALVQTVDFFTPIVDDPYAYGQIAAANALSDVYAMGGEPLTVLNIACFSPTAAPADVWADVLRGAYEKTVEAGAAVAGGHSVDDQEPKFGMAVTGLVDPRRTFANTEAKPGDRIYLSKPIGTGVITTAAKSDACPHEVLAAAIRTMASLNRDAMRLGQAAGVRCATDITGFGLAGHLFNIARASGVTVRLESAAIPILEGALTLAEAGWLTGGAGRNAEFVGAALRFAANVPEAMRQLILDPQTSGGLALFSAVPIDGLPCIGEVEAGPAAVEVT